MNNNKSGINLKNITRNINMMILVILGLLTLVIVTGCIDGENKNGDIETPTPQKTHETTVSSGTEGIIERYSLDKLISMSDSIIVGEVTDVQSEWNTQDGKKPVNSNTSGIIYTDVHIKVGEYLKNPLNMTTITIRVLGGIVEQDKLDVEDQPSYEINEKVLVFLKKDNDPRTKDIGDEHFVITGLIQGKISISQNNEIIIGDEKMSLDDARVIITGK